jgi:hypothetical protein
MKTMTGNLLMADPPGGRMSKYYSYLQPAHTTHNLTCHQYDFMIQKEMCSYYVLYVCMYGVCVGVQVMNISMVYNDNKCHTTDCIGFANYRRQTLYTSRDRHLVSLRCSKLK